MALKNAILNGFGAGAVQGDLSPGYSFPAQPSGLLLPTNDATLQLQGDAFSEPTLITIRRLADNFQLSGFTGVQKPPHYDYDATNSSTNNTVATHKPKPGSALMAFCFEPPDAYYGSGASIGHNPVGGGFELVQEVEVTPALQAELSACDLLKSAAPERGCRDFLDISGQLPRGSSCPRRSRQ